MISRVGLLFLPVLVFAQDHVPPYVDQELRARVSGFYQNFMEGSYSPRKAESFIAEDTQDYFYTAEKLKFLSFKIDTITYSDDFTKAAVTVIAKSKKMIAGHPIMLEQPYPTNWKIDNGKWCWTYSPYDVAATPMGGKFQRPGEGTSKVAIEVPKSVAPEDIHASGLSEVKKVPMGIDNAEITLSADRPGSVRVIFTNGADGAVDVGLDGPVVRGLTTTLEPRTVPPHTTAVLTLKFDPADKNGPQGVWEPKGKIPYRIVVSPFNRMYPVELMFTNPK